MNEGNAAAKRVHARISGEVVRDERGDGDVSLLANGRAGGVGFEDRGRRPARALVTVGHPRLLPPLGVFTV